MSFLWLELQEIDFSCWAGDRDIMISINADSIKMYLWRFTLSVNISFLGRAWRRIAAHWLVLLLLISAVWPTVRSVNMEGESQSSAPTQTGRPLDGYIENSTDESITHLNPAGKLLQHTARIHNFLLSIHRCVLSVKQHCETVEWRHISAWVEENNTIDWSLTIAFWPLAAGSKWKWDYFWYFWPSFPFVWLSKPTIMDYSLYLYWFDSKGIRKRWLLIDYHLKAAHGRRCFEMLRKGFFWEFQIRQLALRATTTHLGPIKCLSCAKNRCSMNLH